MTIKVPLDQIDKLPINGVTTSFDIGTEWERVVFELSFIFKVQKEGYKSFETSYFCTMVYLGS